MIELIVGIGEGAGAAIVGGFVGQILGFTRGRAERNITELYTTGQASRLVCLCGHGANEHYDKNNCRHVDSPEGIKGLGKMLPDVRSQVLAALQCKCQKFIVDVHRNRPSTITQSSASGTLEL